MKTLSSRYSLTKISNKYYGNVSVSGVTTNYPMATLTSAGTYSQGYIFVPYIMSQSSSVLISREYEIMLLREERIKKLNKLNSL